MDPTPITSPALVVYCFASIEHDAERFRGGWDRLNTLWAACRAMGTTEPSLSALAPAELPAALTGRRAFQVAASARRSGGAVRSVFVFAEHEIVGLVAALSADSVGADGMSEVLGEWLSHAPPDAPMNGVIEEVTLMVGLCPAGTVVPPDLVGQLGPLAMRLCASAIPLAPGHGPAGTRIWEFRSSVERRRVIALIAPGDRERELDEWVWAVQGRQGLVPFTRYCLNVAKGRYQAGLYRELTPVSELITDTDRAARKVLDRLVEQSNQALDTAALVRADAELQEQQLGDVGLLWRITRLQEMAQTVQTVRVDARRHMPFGALESADGGLFGRDDAELGWLVDQIGRDVGYLDALNRRASAVHSTVSSVVQQTLARRRDRLTLLQTSVIGAVLMALASVQALGYRVPINDALQGPLITTMTVLALALPLLVARWSGIVPTTDPYRWPDLLAACALGGAAGWLISTAGWVLATDRPAPIPVTAGATVAGALILFGTTWLRLRNAGRSNS